MRKLRLATSLIILILGSGARAASDSQTSHDCEENATEEFSSIGDWAGTNAQATLAKGSYGITAKTLDEVWTRHSLQVPTVENQIAFVLDLIATSTTATDGATALAYTLLERMPVPALQDARIQTAIATPYTPDYKGAIAPKTWLSRLIVGLDPSNLVNVDDLFKQIESEAPANNLGLAQPSRRILGTLLSAGFRFQRSDIFTRFFALVDLQFTKAKVSVYDLSDILFSACNNMKDSPFIQQQLGLFADRVYQQGNHVFEARFHKQLYASFFFAGNALVGALLDSSLKRLEQYKLTDKSGSYTSDLNTELDHFTSAIHSYTFHKMLNDPEKDGYERHFLPALSPERARAIIDLYAKVLRGADIRKGIDSEGHRIGYLHLIPSVLLYLESRLGGNDPRSTWSPLPHYFDFVAHVGIPPRPDLGIRWPAWVIQAAKP